MEAHISKRLAEASQKIGEAEKLQNYDDLLKLLNDHIIYLEGLIDQERNPDDSNYLFTLHQVFKLYRKITKVYKSMLEDNKKTDTKLNELTDKIQRLEERFNDWEKMK